ncbi:MAG TPA: hypothetical protein VK846_06175 [Candidatus Limnocylindria bacterium]|nr:hypothetical protein [Candidatus Limnocylindria bacterium]
MHLFFIVAGIVWFALSGLMVLALVCAAKRPWPDPDASSESPAPARQNPLVPGTALEDTADRWEMLNVAPRKASAKFSTREEWINPQPAASTIGSVKE